VVLTASAKGYETARSLREAGADVTIVDLRPDAARSTGSR
jgi:NADPH-dependent 2,4-dienoyl-CoA reductase/sulfur reductase-like enzyme